MKEKLLNMVAKLQNFVHVPCYLIVFEKTHDLG